MCWQEKAVSGIVSNTTDEHPQPSLPASKTRLRQRCDRSIFKILCASAPYLLAGKQYRIPDTHRYMEATSRQVRGY